ncbi:hypothetical protein AJE_00795 [Alishewanella jeotgali KCTC 22429]|uniref:Lipopolysaccharide assembly protein A domain-containing protein n=1 Tax=Alishewanella jeotgali KCTC 22429 TaxID=1129374 RepID=H3ZA07_9ALTE|nr:hypothetical protein AJE_00795 [Alishewanella jeotgali KCTC 22429]OCW98281.1 hypothetical protein A9165_02120 [Alishewanella sp. HH-ZS]
MRRLVFIFFTLLVILLGFLLGSTNQQLTELNLLVVRLELRVVDIAVIFLVTGLLLGLVFSLLFSLQRKTRGWFSKTADKA